MKLASDRIRRWLGPAILVLLSTPPAQGAETLEQAWQEAMDQDLALSAARLDVSAAEEELAAARARRYPAVSASGSLMKMDETPAFDFAAAGMPIQLPLYTGSAMASADARMTLPLYTSGALGHGIDAAASGLEASRSQARSREMDTRLQVSEAFVNVLRARSGLRVAESNLKSLQAHARDVADMFAAGLVPRNDHLSAQVALADASQRRLQAANLREVAEAAYNRSLGRPLDRPVDLDSAVPVVTLELPAGSPSELAAMALERRPELAGLESGSAALQAQARATRARSLPQLALTGGYAYLENQFLNQEDYWMVGLGFSWDLFDSGRNRHEASALSSRARALSHRRQDLESYIGLQVRQAWLQMEEARQRVVVTEGAVAQASENLRVVRDRYRNGEGTNTEVLDAQGLSDLSQQNYDNARYDVEISRIRLARALGLL